MGDLRMGRLPHRAGRTAGQSLVEFALVLPVILLITLIALDFGRVYLGYINLQNMARIAANYAANNPTAAWGSTTDVTVLAYRNRILNDAKATNCQLPTTAGQAVVPSPAFADRTGNGTTTDVGDSARVSLTCSFQIITPIISSIVGSGGNLAVSASAEFPIKTGLLGTGGGMAVAPVAAFTGTPLTGAAPLIVQFTDHSADSPTSWAWDFNHDGIIDSTQQDPRFTFGSPGTYTVTLIATNAAGSDTLSRTDYVTVTAAVSAVSYTATPISGARPLTVAFTDTSTGSPTAWAWDFDNNGTTDSTVQNPSHTYTTVGTYSVKLTVTNAGGSASSTVSSLITVTVGTCVVPSFANTSSSQAQKTWGDAGFTTTVAFQQGNLPWTIKSQNQVVGQSIPCNSPITVNKN